MLDSSGPRIFQDNLRNCLLPHFSEETSVRVIHERCIGSVYIFLSFINPFTGTHEPNKLTSSQLSGFIAQLVEHCTGISEVMGSESR